MSRVVQVILLLLASLAPVTMAQTARPDPTELFKELLAKPAPTPIVDEEPNTDIERLRNFMDQHTPPGDDADLRDLMDYWTIWSDHRRLPSDKVRQRLLDGSVAEPEKLVRLVGLMPKTKSAAAKIKEIFDREETNRQFDTEWRVKVKDWLLYNTDAFLTELVQMAQQVKEDEAGYADTLALESLAKVDWESAEPLVIRLNNSGQPRSATLALALLYHRAIEEKQSAAEERYRNQLKAIVSDRNSAPWARVKAIDELSLTEWAGRDEWYLSLFQDETLLRLKEEHQLFAPLTTLFNRDPEKWIPTMARLTESKDLAVRSAAASCLLSATNISHRREALLPLLPWLTNPGWIKYSSSDRSNFIASFGKVDVPESVTGLIWIVENDVYGYEGGAAAASLTRYRDPRAIPALKRALSRAKSQETIINLIRGLLACNGFTDREQLDAIEAYAVSVRSEEARAQMWKDGEQLSAPVLMGSYLTNSDTVSDGLVQLILTRIEDLKKSDPTLAATLRLIVNGWQGRVVDLDLIRRIKNGSADANTIVQGLIRAAKWRENFDFELRGLLEADGPAQGFGVVLLGNSSLTDGILASNDQLAQMALLASARLLPARLSVELVGRLLRSKNELLALAAERYLLFEDSKDARELLWQHHSNKAFVTGWLEDLDYFERPVTRMKDLEKRLQAELLKEDGPVEIYAFISDNVVQAKVLRVYSDKAVFADYENSSRYRERVVPDAELTAFKDFVALQNLSDRGPLFDSCEYCGAAEYLHLTKSKGRRLFSRGSFIGEGKSVPNAFAQLGQGESILRYHLESKIKGVEVLFVDEELKAEDVWLQGSEVRVLVKRSASNTQIEHFNPNLNAEQVRDYVARYRDQEKNLSSWRILADGRVNRVAAEPEGYKPSETSSFANILANGVHRNPVVTPDKKWMVVSKSDKAWTPPTYIIRVNLQTGREFRVNVPAADDFDPVMFLQLQGRVLLRRAKFDDNEVNSVGPDRPEYYLLDPATGDTRLVRGEFAPFQPGKRALQPTEKPNEFWVAIADQEKNQTRVGRYDVKDFSFKALVTLPNISFDTYSMWIDAKNEKLYVVYDGQLLRLPFKPGP